VTRPAAELDHGAGKPLVIPWELMASLEPRFIRLRQSCQGLHAAALEANEVLLREQIMDQQIVDCRGLKLQRVNDIAMALSDGTLCSPRPVARPCPQSTCRGAPVAIHPATGRRRVIRAPPIKAARSGSGVTEGVVVCAATYPHHPPFPLTPPAGAADTPRRRWAPVGFTPRAGAGAIPTGSGDGREADRRASPKSKFLSSHLFRVHGSRLEVRGSRFEAHGASLKVRGSSV